MAFGSFCSSARRGGTLIKSSFSTGSVLRHQINAKDPIPACIGPPTVTQRGSRFLDAIQAAAVHRQNITITSATATSVAIPGGHWHCASPPDVGGARAARGDCNALGSVDV